MTLSARHKPGIRGSLAALTLAAIALGALATAPDAEHQAALELQLQTLRSAADSGDASLRQGLDAWNGHDPMRDKARLQGLEQALARLTRRRDSLAAGLLPDEPGRYLLQALDSQDGSLGLHDLQQLDTDRNAPGEPLPHLGRQRLSLTVDGHFPALLHYLEDIQALPWALRIEVLELTVTEHPMARMQLILNALRKLEGQSDV